MTYQDLLNYARSSSRSWMNNPLGILLNLFGLRHDQENIASIDTQEASMLYNSAEADKQRNWETEMLHETQAYNSPSAQMQRLRDAGLNPSLAYGQPIAEAQPPAGAEASYGGSVRPLPAESMIDGISKMIGVTGLLDEQKELLKWQAEEYKSRVPINQQKVINMRTELGKVIAETDNLVKDLSVKESQIELNKVLGQQAANTAIKIANDNKLFMDTYDQQLQLFTSKVEQQGYLTKQDKIRADTLLQSIQSEINKNIESLKVMQSEATKNWAQASECMALVAKLEEEAKMIATARDLKEEFGAAHEIVDMVTQSIGTLGSIGIFLRGVKSGRKQDVSTTTNRFDEDGNFSGMSQTTTTYPR